MDARSTPLQRVEITGAVVASMLGSCLRGGDSDGLLFGRVQRRVTSHLQDDGDEPEMREDISAVVTGCLCSGTLMSFYNASGDVDRRSLESMVSNRRAQGGDPLIGWLRGRRNTPMEPSMREMAVSAALAALPPPPTRRTITGLIAYSDSEDDSDSGDVPSDGTSDRPCLFLLVSDFRAEHPSSVHTHEYRAFEHSTMVGLQPLKVVVRNVGGIPFAMDDGSGGVNPYDTFLPVSPLPWLRGGSSSEDAEGCGRKVNCHQRPSLTDGVTIREMETMVTSGGVGGVETLYQSFLSKLESLAQEVQLSSAEVEKQERYVSQLKRSLGYFS